MTPLAGILARRIGLEGPIPLSEFMATVLGHPQHGYYMRGDPFGAEGDFVTAPEISQMFGELIGLWCAEMWRLMGSPDQFQLVELGPGRGTLMSDALRSVRVLPGFAEAADVHLVESSPALRDRQRSTLADHSVTWHDAVGDVPDGPMILIANEFFDALPIHQFERTQNGWRERAVALDGERLVLALSGDPSPAEVLIPPGVRISAAIGEVAEVAPASVAIMTGIAERLAGHGGAALIVDYGHASHGTGETIQAVRGHAFRDILDRPGDSDLTAHVDFAALAAAAKPKARVYGPVGQGQFLTSLGLDVRCRQLAQNADARQRAEIEAARHRLIDPAEMGTLFKVLAVCDRDLAPPPGLDAIGTID